MCSKIKIGNIRLIIVIIFCFAIGILLFYKFTGQKKVQKKAPIVDEHLIKNKDTQAAIKQFEKKVYSEGKLLYKLVSEFATYSPTSEKRLITLENILPDTVFYNKAGDEYHLTASRGEMDEITHNTSITGNIKVTSQDGLSFETKSINYIGTDNILFSNDRFHIFGQGLDVDGLGFKIDLGKRTVEMENRVKTRIAASKNILEIDDIKAIPKTIKKVRSNNQKIYIESDKFKYDDNSGTVSYIGNVFIIYEGYFINCDRLEINLDEKRTKFITLNIYGNVHITDENETFKGVCQKIVYDILTKKAEFSVNPKIWSFSKMAADSTLKDHDVEQKIKFEIPTIKNRLLYYPFIQNEIIKFIPAFYSKQIPKFEFMIEDTMSLIADKTITGDSMFYQSDSFNVQGNVIGTFSLNKNTPSFINDDKLLHPSNSIGGALQIHSNSLKYDFINANIEFHDQVYVEKDKNSINSNLLLLKFDNTSKSIQQFVFKDGVKSTFFISPQNIEKISKESNKKEQSETEKMVPLKINSNELLYSSFKNFLEYKDNVEIFCEDSFVFCDTLFILQNPENLE
ncbi:LPS export ABC transporter periplasmic protein LptC, partial [bacterium]|nr:LPS export ABC transporter periplasmic protein LptC [bacterium]